MQTYYLGDDSQPMTVEPMRTRDRWITEANGWQHKETAHRGAEFDRKAMKESESWYLAQQGPISFFTPSTRQFDVADKWPIPQGYGCQMGMHGERRDPSRWGMLPSIKQMLYDASLPNKSRGDIEHEMREASRREAHRLFDTSGYCR